MPEFFAPEKCYARGKITHCAGQSAWTPQRWFEEAESGKMLHDNNVQEMGNLCSR
jgi:hypothetical protein